MTGRPMAEAELDRYWELRRTHRYAEADAYARECKEGLEPLPVDMPAWHERSGRLFATAADGTTVTEPSLF